MRYICSAEAVYRLPPGVLVAPLAAFLVCSRSARRGRDSRRNKGMSRIASGHILDQLIHVLQFLGVLCGFFAHSAADAVTDENTKQTGLGRNAVGNQTVVVNQTAMVNVPAGKTCRA